MYTRCPECETMFHLRVEDLRQAGGRVRCGECNHVFYGMDYLAEEPEAAANETAEELAAEVAPVTEPELDGKTPTWPDADLDEYAESSGAEDPEDQPQPEDILFTSDDSTPAENAAEIGAAMSMLTSPDISTESPITDDDDESNDLPGAAADISTEAWEAELEELERATDADDETAVEQSATEAERDTEVEPEDTVDESDEISADLAGAEADDFDEQWEAAATDTDESNANAEIPEDDDDETDDFDIDDTIWEKIPGVGTIKTDTGVAELAEPGHDDTGEFLTTELLASAEDAGAPAEIQALTTIADETQVDDHDSAVEPTADDEEDEDSDLEFNVPEEEWATVFETSSDFAAVADNDTDAETDHMQTQTAEIQTPPWQFDKYRNVDLERYSSYAGFWAICLAILTATLVGQLVHYNRDSLAAHPTYGENIRNLYAFLDLPLYPRWPIDDYEIRGSEAVVGETGPDVMDIRTQIAAVGDHAIGLPVLRVVLRDRWSNPVAERNFGALEYAAREDLPADNLLQPNSSLAARLSIIDPGSGAQGYELELCVPYRGNRLECSGQTFK